MPEMFNEASAKENPRKFKNIHGERPSVVLNMKETALNMLQAIRQDIEINRYTKANLEELGNDKDIQKKFDDLMVEVKQKPGDFDVLDKIMALPRVEQAAWMLFTIQYHEKLWNLTLLTDEEREIKE